MNVTQNVIADLLPLYAENECSPDTRALVDEYLQLNPKQAEELRRVLEVKLPLRSAVPAADLQETAALRRARRAVRRRSWFMAVAIFCSLAPFSVIATGDKVIWLLLRDAPLAAACYGAVGAAFWVLYFYRRARERDM
jgi:ferric-dicitrate binding protein FerR (iron transport regulator)